MLRPARSHIIGGMDRATHPIWMLATGLLLVAVLALFLHFNYHNGFDFEKDIRTLAGFTVTYFGACAWRIVFGKARKPPEG